MRFVSTVVCAVAVAAAIGGSGCSLGAHLTRATNDLPAFTDAPGRWTTTTVAMRDGTRLSTRVLLPRSNRGTTPSPLVVIRNAYPIALIYEGQCDLLAHYGIGCVVQDVRGRGESEGAWFPFLHEIDDGKDTLDWVRAQPWSGELALIGMSYLGGTALATAMNGLPPDVKTLVVTDFGTDLPVILGERGMLHHETATTWTAFMPGNQSPDNAGDRYRDMLAARPHAEATVKAFGKELPWYRPWLDAVASPEAVYWQGDVQKAFAALPAKLTVPVLLVGGFDDPFLEAQLSTWEQLASRDQSLFVIQPTNHIGMQAGDVKASDLPRGMPPAKFLVPWLLTHLAGAPPALPVNAVHVRARQDDAPRVESQWPPLSTPTSLALTSDEVKGLSCASHALGASTKPSTVSFTYDPDHPWRVAGSARGIAFAIPGMNGLTPGPVQLPWECDRDDVVRFTGAPLAAPMRMAGRATVELTVQSDARDTAFAVKLVDVDAQGRAVHVSDGIATLRRPTRAPEEVPYEPGSSRTLTLELYPNEWVFLEGHRVGLWVSSSIFPTFSVHMNTETPWYLETKPRIAKQTIEVGGGGSTLVLPVVLPGTAAARATTSP